MDKWAVIHRYNRLAAEGKVKPLLCPDCDTQLVSMMEVTDDDNPRLWCPFDDTRMTPGLAFWDQLNSVMKEWYV